MCDVCAAHGDGAAVGVDVDAQGSSLREDESNFPLKRLCATAAQFFKLLPGHNYFDQFFIFPGT